MSRREPLRTRKLFKIPADHFWCRRCEAWLNPAFFEREHPHRAKQHPSRAPQQREESRKSSPGGPQG